MRPLAALAILSLVVTAGCSSPPHAVDWRAEGLALRGYPASHRHLFLRDVTVTEVAPLSTLVPVVEEERLPIAADVVRTKLREALAGLGLFQDVTDVVASAPHGTAGLVLDVAFDDAFLIHQGENDDANKAFWLWLFTGLPGLAVRDQLYGLHFDARARIVDAATGEVVVPWEPLTKPASEPYALNFHERASGILSYLKTNVMPPSRITVDEREVLGQILPATLRPSLGSLVRLFDQIQFLPVSRVEVAPVAGPKAMVHSVRVPGNGEVLGDTMSLVLTVTVEGGVQTIREVRVGGATKLELTPDMIPPTAETTARIALDGVELPEDGKGTEVELILDGVDKPQRVLVIQAARTKDVRPDRRR